VSNSDFLLINEMVLSHIINHKILGKKFVSRIISEVLNLDYNIVLNNIKVKDNNIKISDFSVDYLLNNVLEKNSLIIDLRLSYTSNEFLSFLYELDMSLFNYSKRKKKIVQLFIDSKDRFQKNKFLYNVCCMEKNELVFGNKFFEKYYINLNYLRNISEKKIFYEKKILARSLYFCVFYSKKILGELYVNDELMLKIMRELKKYYLHEEIPLYYDDYNKIKYLYEEYFLNDAVTLGIYEEKKRMIKSLYDNGATLDLIRRATDVSLDEIKRVIEGN